jgi:hypothetical protein
MTGYGDIKLTFRNDSNTFDFPLYTDTGSVNLALGQLVFKITQNKFIDIKKLYESGINLFYITSDIQSVKSVVYSGLFKIYDSTANVAGLNQEAASSANPAIIKDPKLPQETAVVTRRPVKQSEPVVKPGRSPIGSGGFSDIKLKENIKNIGKSKLGINIYEWNYINDINSKYKGVIAQELIGTKFESSLSIKNGFYWVDYSNLDVEFEKIN